MKYEDFAKQIQSFRPNPRPNPNIDKHLDELKQKQSMTVHVELKNNDKDVVLAAVQQAGTVLEYASDELKNDRDVVLAAVQNNGDALEYASNELKNEIESCGLDNWIQRELHRQETGMPPMGNVTDTIKAAYAKKQNTFPDASNRDTKNKDASDISDDKR